jgi:hypothetical protein
MDIGPVMVITSGSYPAVITYRRISRSCVFYK